MKFFKRYYFILIPTAVLIAVFIWFLQGRPTISTEGYSADNVYNTIKELSSDKYKGRRYGTNENLDAVKFVEEQFKTIGLKPAGKDNSYIREYYVNASSYKGAAVLEVLDRKGKIVKQYKYGEDFKEQSYGYSAPGDITSLCNSIVYNGEKTIDTKATDDVKIAVVYNKDETLRYSDGIYVSLGKAGYSALITTVADSINLRKESANLEGRFTNRTGYEIPTVIAKDRVAKEIVSYVNMGYKVHLKSTFDVVSSISKDVLGMIPGRSGDYLFITAHIDHVGPASDGTIYPGALDDASGTGAMIEMARFIKSQGKTPSENIVFVAFNGEEGGNLGSTGYVYNPIYPLYMTKVINLDMIGYRDNVPLTLMYATGSSYAGRQQDPSSKMRYHLKNLSKSIGMDVDEKNSTSGDHMSFTEVGVPAVTLANIDSKNNHTPLDNIDNVDKKNIERDLKVIASFISMEAFSNVSAGGYSIALEDAKDFLRCQYPLFLLLIITLVFLYIVYKHREINKKIKKFPIFTAIVITILMGIISYFSVNYPYAPANSSLAFISLIGRGLLSAGVSVLMVPMFLLSMLPGFIALFIVRYRMHSWKYEGSGKEYNIVYGIAIIVTVLSSIIVAVVYNDPAYYAVTPDFARNPVGVGAVYLCISLCAYFIYKLFCFESRIKNKNLVSLTAFCIIFFLLLSSFYIPISTNKYVINLNAGNITVNGYTK